MRQSVPRGNKKKAVQPVIITTENQFKPKISERTIKRKKELKDRQLKGSKYASGLDLCGVVCLYMFLILCIIIGGGGIGVCAYYFNDNADTQGWKIAGIAMGAVVVIIGFILVLLTIFKQTRNRPWRYKKKDDENLNITNEYYGDMNDDDDDQTNIEEFDDDTRIMTPPSSTNRSPVERNTRETASSPMQDPLAPPSDLKTLTSDIIFCPGCNRSHPSSHQCMYSTRVANGFAIPFRPKQVPQHDSIAIQTEEDGKIQKRLGTHTVIDRSLKYSNTTQTQTDVSANPRSNITESIILRRVPIPTAKVVVQQPTTKVMIVKVPNVAGQLVIQPKSESRE